MTKEKAEQVTRITLTDERPVNVKNGLWPVVATASDDKDHNNQVKFRRYYLRVRQHDTGADLEELNPHEDGRCLVYGWYSTSFQGESGSQAGYRCQIENAVETIRKVGERIGAPQWLIDECVADLPAVEEKESAARMKTITQEDAEALANKWIERERELRTKVEQGRKDGSNWVSQSSQADQIATCRRELQEVFGLVASAEEVRQLIGN